MFPTQESHQVEFKLSFQEEVIVSLVAFANSKGGTIYIGVADNGEVKGVQIGKETLASWSNEIKNKTAPVLLPDLEEVEVEGKVVVKIVVPEYPVKPVSTKGRYYKRKGNANLQLSVAEVVDIHLKTLNSSWDAFPDQQHTIEDLSFEKVQAAIDRKNQTSTLPDNVPENVPENRDNLILEFIKQKETISMEELAEKLNVNIKTIKRDLQKLKQKKLLQRIGPAKGGHWEILNNM